MENLRDAAKAPTTSNENKDWLCAFLTSGKEELRDALEEAVASQKCFDIVIVDSTKELDVALEKLFKMLHGRGTSPVGDTKDWTIEKQLDSMGDGQGFAYQPLRDPEHSYTTHRVSMRMVRAAFADQVVNEARDSVLYRHCPSRGFLRYGMRFAPK